RLRCDGSSTRAPGGRELAISLASSGSWTSTSLGNESLRMSEYPYLQWPVFRRSVVAAFQRSLTCAACAAVASSRRNEKKAAGCPINSPMAVRNLRAPVAAPVGFVGRTTEQAGKLVLMNGQGPTARPRCAPDHLPRDQILSDAEVFRATAASARARVRPQALPRRRGCRSPSERSTVFAAPRSA